MTASPEEPRLPRIAILGAAAPAVVSAAAFSPFVPAVGAAVATGFLVERAVRFGRQLKERPPM